MQLTSFKIHNIEKIQRPFEKFVDWRQCAHCYSTNFSNGPCSCYAILKRVLLKDRKSNTNDGYEYGDHYYVTPHHYNLA
jgi:hypothetical protein